MKELDALLKAAEVVRSESARLHRLGVTAQTVMGGLVCDSRPVDAAMLGAKAVQALRAEGEAMYEEFERAAFAFTGEPRRSGEIPEEYFFRIVGMSSDELLATAVRNGLTLNLWSPN